MIWMQSRTHLAEHLDLDIIVLPGKSAALNGSKSILECSKSILCMFVYVCVCVFISLCVCVCVCVRMCVYMCLCVWTHLAEHLDLDVVVPSGKSAALGIVLGLLDFVLRGL